MQNLEKKVRAFLNTRYMFAMPHLSIGEREACGSGVRVMGKVAVHTRRRRAGYVRAMVEVLERRVLLSGTVAGGLVGGAVGGAVFSQAVGFVTSSTASTLSFEALPAAGTLGSAVGPIKVDVDTRTGQVDTTSKASVTLSISSNGHVIKTLVVEARMGWRLFRMFRFRGEGRIRFWRRAVR